MTDTFASNELISHIFDAQIYAKCVFLRVIHAELTKIVVFDIFNFDLSQIQKFYSIK